jgi:hypothetical protein
MIKVITGFTEEVDFVEDAAAELKAQIRPEVNLQAHSLGILHCHPDFFDRGLLGEIRNAFGFPVIGAAACGVSVPGKVLSAGLSLTVLTSGEARFSAAASGEINGENLDEETAKIHASLTGGGTEKPAMFLCYTPLLMPIGAGEILESLAKYAPEIPVFGAVAVSGKPRFAGSSAIFGGEVLANNRFVLAAVFTDKPPSFHALNPRRDKVLHLREQVSMAKGRVLISIGDKTYRDYMIANKLPVTGVTPFLFFLPDGTALTRTCIQITEEGYGVFAGEIPLNAGIAVCTSLLTEGGVLESTAGFLEALGKDQAGGGLLYSCMSRLFIIGANRAGETALAQKNLEGRAFNMAYAGGEIAPLFREDGRVVNLLNNTSLIACMFT